MGHAALDELLAIAGRAPQEDDEVVIEGADPVLPTAYRIGEAGAAAIAATGVAVSDLWKLRTGRRQRVTVGVRAAAAAMRSARYLRVLDREAGSGPANPITGHYAARDGRWIYLHCNFPHHRAGALALLECEDDREAVRASVGRWDAEALEDALAKVQLCGGVVRTADEWRAHPQGKAVAALPLLEVIKIGESPPEPFGEGERPLWGIRVLDLTRVLAGPTCARTLAEHGADVLRISAAHLPSFEALVMDTGHGKRSAHLDLRDEQDASRMRELVREGDIFSQAYRPGALDRLGFSAEALAVLRPGIVYVSLSAFGHEGPWRDRRGWDSLVQNVSGIVADHAVDGQPRLMPAQPIDYTTGYLGAFGALVALARRASEGGSYLVRVSLAQTGRWISDRGRVDEAAVAAQPPDLPDDEIAKLTVESETPFGRLRHLAPVVQLSETPARWERPAAPLGSSEPMWLS